MASFATPMVEDQRNVNRGFPISSLIIHEGWSYLNPEPLDFRLYLDFSRGTGIGFQRSTCAPNPARQSHLGILNLVDRQFCTSLSQDVLLG